MRRRVSKELIEAKRAELARAKEQRERFQTILEGKDTPFWKEIAAKLDVREAAVADKLDEYAGMPEREVWALLEQRRMVRFFRDMVNESENTVKMLDARVGKLEEALGDMKEGAVVSA